VKFCYALWLQYCKSRKVRSSKHSGVEYWYSKCTPIPGSRTFGVNDINDDKTDLQELIRYLDSKTSTNSTDVIVETDFDQTATVLDDEVQEPIEMVDNNLEDHPEELDEDEHLDGAEVFQDWETAENEFEKTMERAEDDFEQPMEMVDVDIQEPLKEEFLDDAFVEEPLDVDNPIFMT